MRYNDMTFRPVASDTQMAFIHYMVTEEGEFYPPGSVLYEDTSDMTQFNEEIELSWFLHKVSNLGAKWRLERWLLTLSD